MKSGLIHVCFIIDESGSMYPSINDVVGGFKKVINEQKAVKDGECLVSLFKFHGHVTEVYVGKNVNDVDVDKFEYSPGGWTAMNDGICTGIDRVGKWLSDMDENERPEKNLIVIMTDGEENSSSKFSIDQVREKIEHQTEKYNWSFIYMGTDVSDSSYTNKIMGGIRGCAASYNSRDNYMENYSIISSNATSFRKMKGVDTSLKCAMFDASLGDSADEITKEYEKKTGNTIKR